MRKREKRGEKPASKLENKSICIWKRKTAFQIQRLNALLFHNRTSLSF